jgi:hypothetical protein
MTTTTNKQKYYVAMTDNFMSGWGKAQGKTNKLVIECDTYEQAALIEKNARTRSEMKYINICTKKPYYRSNVLVSMKHFSDMSGMWLK